MLKYKGRTLNVNDNLLKEHGKYYDVPLEEWRIENYIRQRAKNIDDNISDIMSALSDEVLIDYIESGLQNEIAASSTPADEVKCLIHNPKLRKKDNSNG